ncbi:MAG: hypothetical protein WDZ88_01370 [Candidatus Paceibacterota bacterium]
MLESADIIKVFIPALSAFMVGILCTPALTSFLYKNKVWKKVARTQGLGGGLTPIFNKLHKEKEVGTPRMGGVIIWFSALVTTILFALLPYVTSYDLFEKLNFLSRDQTWLPLFTLLVASLLGLIDDYLVVKGNGGYIAGGLPLWMRIGVVGLIGVVGGWWFQYKLDGFTDIVIPFWGTLELGYLFIPFFTIIMIALFSGGVIDGIDGLSGGVMASIFSSYAVIAFAQDQINIATFCTVVVGGILAFLWFNIPPARFYMSETGMLGLTTTITVIAFLTKAVIVLPLIALPLILSSLSVIIQIFYKKVLGRKFFKVAPLHHHFEAIGWPGYKVTMRAWIFSIVCSVAGTIVALML